MGSLLSQLVVPHSLRRSEAFHHAAVNHFPYIRRKNLFKQTPVSDLYCSVYQGDFHGLLQHLNVQYSSLRVNTEFNDFHSTNDYDGSKILVSIIDEDFLSNLFNKFITTKK